MQQQKRISPLVRSVFSTIVVILLSIVIAYGAMRILLKNAQDVLREEELETVKAELDDLQAERVLIFEELEEFRRIKTEEEAEAARIRAAQATYEKAEAGPIAAEERAAAAARAEAERMAVLYDYKNGRYTANGPYVTDRGKVTESLDVTLTINKDIVTSINLVGHLVKTKSHKYHAKFEKEIGSVVIGKDIDSLNVHGIGGASDTSTGFRVALDRIKAQAKNS